MDENNLKIVNFDEENLFRDINFAKLKSLIKEYSLETLSDFVTNVDYFKDFVTFYSLKFQSPFEDFFLKLETAHYFFYCDSPVIKAAEEALKINSTALRGGVSDNYRLVKEMYNRWVNARQAEDKKSFAVAIVNLVEKSVTRNNFLTLIIYGIIYLYEDQIYYPTKSIELFEQAAGLIEKSKLEEKHKNYLLYIVKLYNAFALIKIQNYSEASLKLFEASKYFPNSITVKYYTAYCEKLVGNVPTALSFISEILTNDVNRIRYAIENNNFQQLAYSVKHAVFYNVLYEIEYADLFMEVNGLLEPLKENNGSELYLIDEKLERLDRLEMKIHYNDEVIKIIEFLHKCIDYFGGSSNVLFTSNLQLLFQKLKRIIDIIIDNIRQVYLSQINIRLITFDDNIKTFLDVIHQIQKEIETVKKTLDEQLEKALKEYTDSMDKSILALEEKINDIDFVDKYNPSVSFKNSMIYNAIISIFVLIVGGFSALYSSTTGDFKDTSLQLLISGFKWGALAFFIGMIVSIVMAGLAVVEKNNEKQRLTKRLNLLKNQRELGCERLKKDHEEKFNKYLASATEKINTTQKQVEFTKKEKETEYQRLLEDVENKVAQQSKQLLQILEDNTEE